MIDTRTLLLACVLATAACTSAPPGPPMSTTTLQSAGPNRGLETPNGLPLGAITSSPFAPSTGVYGVTRVGP